MTTPRTTGELCLGRTLPGENPASGSRSVHPTTKDTRLTLMSIPTHAPALTVPRHGGSDVLEVREEPVPQPGPGQVLVKAAAVGVNFIDVYQREGVYPMTLPFVPCSEGAGEVVAVGPDLPEDATFAVGDRVAWASFRGSGRAYVAVPATVLVPVPDGLDLDVAAASLLQGMTAHYLVHSTRPIEKGDVALVHAAAGGVGQLLVQMITAMGGSVVATAGSPEKLEIARSRGAAQTINYRDHTPESLAAAVREAAGRGVDVVYDGVGKDTFDASLASLRPRGMVVLFGGSSGQVPPFDLQRLNSAGSVYVTRPSLGHYVATREEMLWRAESVLGDLAAGSLELEVGGTYPLADAARAYDDLEGRRTTGKLLLVP